MLFKFSARFINRISVTNRRAYYSSKINALFINNFNKYDDRLKNDENSHHKNQIQDLMKGFKCLSQSITDVEKEISSENQLDKELQGLMKEEKVEMESRQSDLEAKILDEIHSYELSKDKERIPDSSSILFEISPGVGGKEAMLFANEIYTMYYNYFQYKNWELVDLDVAEESGYMRHCKAKVEGSDVWGHMKYEAGVHRVQRIPETESRGRIHTSTVSLACIPVTDDSGVEVNEKDLKIQTKTATGAGGQHVNKTESAIRIVHIPSGVMVECQEDRSQIKNREIAMYRLRKILTERHITEMFEKVSKTRKSQVGQANRNEKIRTYNFGQDRVTDHRLSALNVSSSEKNDSQFDLPSFFTNPERLDTFIKSLQRVEKERELIEIFTDLENKK